MCGHLKLTDLVHGQFIIFLISDAAGHRDSQNSQQGCTKSGILVTGLPANQIVGSQILAGPKAQPVKSNSQPAKNS